MANPWLTQGQMRLLELYPPVATQGNLTFGLPAPHASDEAPPPSPPQPALGTRLTREQHRALLQQRIRDVLHSCSAHLAKAALQRRTLATYATRELAARAAPKTAAAPTDARVSLSSPLNAPGAFLALQPSPPQSGPHPATSFCRHDTSKAAPAYGEAPGGACSNQVYGLSGEPSFRTAAGQRTTAATSGQRPATPEGTAGRAGTAAAARPPPPPPPSSDEVELVSRRLEAAGVPDELARQAAVLQADLQRARCAVAHDVERLRRLENAAAAARSRRSNGTPPSFVPRRRPTTTSFARQPASRSRSHSQRRRSTATSFASSATDDAVPTRGDAHRRARRRQSSAAPSGGDAAAAALAATARRESRASGRRASRAQAQRRRTRSRASRATLTDEGGVRRRRSRKGTKESAADDDDDGDDDAEHSGRSSDSGGSCSGDDAPSHITSTMVLGTMYQKAALVRSKLKENKSAAVQAAAASAGASGAGLIEWGSADGFEHLAVAARVAALREHQHAVLDDIVGLVEAEAQRVEKAYHEAVERVARRGRKAMQQQQQQQQQAAAAGAGADSAADAAGHAKREQALQEGLKLTCVKEFTMDMMKTGRYVDPDVLNARVDKLEEGIGTMRASNERQTRLVQELDEEVKTLTYMVDALSDEHKDVLLSEYSRQVLRDSRTKKATVEVQCDIRVVDYEVETKAKAIVRRECLLRSELGIFKATLANVAAFKKVIASDLTCRACFDSFVAPVTLHPCGHSVCSRCVADLCVDDAQGLKCADCGSMSHQQPRRNHALRGLVAKWCGASAPSPLTKVDAVLSQSAAEVAGIEATLRELDERLAAAAGAGAVV